MKKLTSIFVIIICFCFVAGCSGKTVSVDAKDLVEVRFEGLNTKGKALVNGSGANRNAVIEEYGTKTKDTQKKTKFFQAYDSIDYQILSDNDNLSNGDEIRIKAVYDEALLKEANLIIENAEFTYTVAGLTEAVMLDPFAEIELVYENPSPDARVAVYNRSEKQFIRDITYKVVPSQNLRIGDKIVVTAEVNAADAESNRFVVPDVLTREYTVENIDEYIKDFNDIDQSARDKMEKEGLDRVESYSVKSSGSLAIELELNGWSFDSKGKIRDHMEDATFEQPELTNIYFNTLKQGASGADSWNDIFYVYKVTVHYAEELEPRIAYAAVRFKNAIKKADSTTEIDTAYTASLFSSDPLVYAVGKNLDEVYREIVTAQKKWYEIQEITP